MAGLWVLVGLVIAEGLRQGAVEAPGYEDGSAFGVPVREITFVVLRWLNTNTVTQALLSVLAAALPGI